MRKDEGHPIDMALLPAVPVGLPKVLGLVVSGEATSRAEIARRSGLARSTVGQQIDHLVGHGILQENEAGESVRGRPPRVLTLSPRAGTVVVADVDTLATQVAVADLGGRVLAQETVGVPVGAGPEVVLKAVTERLFDLLERCGREPDRVRKVVMGLPGPVDSQRGWAVRPTGMPGWDGYPVAERLRTAFRAPALVDNDANLMALGEAARDEVDTPLLGIKIGTGIGAGIVTVDGEVYRGRTEPRAMSATSGPSAAGTSCAPAATSAVSARSPPTGPSCAAWASPSRPRTTRCTAPTPWPSASRTTTRPPSAPCARRPPRSASWRRCWSTCSTRAHWSSAAR